MTDIILRAIAIDDEPPALAVIKAFAEKIPFLQLECTYNNPVEGYKSIETLKPDLVFLDIQMPEFTGINIAEKLPTGQMLIFTTAHSRYAVEGFNLNAVDYLLKPYDFKRFMQAVDRAKEQHVLRLSMDKNSKQEFILIKKDYQNVKVFIEDILYIEGLDNYVKIHTNNKMLLTLMNLKAIAALLPQDKFVRVHKSFIVQMSKINYFTKEKVIIDKYTVPVGRSYANSFLDTIKNAGK